jgi:hypothetical protein
MITYHTDGTLPVRNDAIFVFGSNLKGIHGKGAAKVAKERFGAIIGTAEGLRGKSYAIPTKRTPYEPLTLEEVEYYVNRFVQHCSDSWSGFYFLTRVGCGLAGFDDRVIAPMFKGIAKLEMQSFSIPENWRNIW